MPRNEAPWIARALWVTLLLAPQVVGQQPASSWTVETESGPRRVHCHAIRTTLRGDDGQPVAMMHAYGYLGEDPRHPITFFWNGGPGLASVILHTAFAAPRIADLVGGDGMRDNPLTLLDRTDLVYVDPIGTGFSRAIAPARESDFFGVLEDARAAAQFVAAVVAEHGWAERPIYLCGESYAGIRVAAMLAPLRERGIVPEGLVLISPALETRTLQPMPDSEDGAIREVDLVPTLAAVAVAMGRREVEDLHADVEAVCRFSHGPLLAAVRAGSHVEDLRAGELGDALARFTAGVSLRALRRQEPYDARWRYRAARWGGMKAGAKERAMREILRQRFGVSPTGYRGSARSVGFRWRGWDGRHFALSDERATDRIADACEHERRPRVFVAGGWYDTVVPFAVARRLAAEGAFGACEVEVHDYPGGHVVYLEQQAHADLVADLRAWFDRRVR